MDNKADLGLTAVDALYKVMYDGVHACFTLDPLNIPCDKNNDHVSSTVTIINYFFLEYGNKFFYFCFFKEKIHHRNPGIEMRSSDANRRFDSKYRSGPRRFKPSYYAGVIRSIDDADSSHRYFVTSV